MTQMIKKVTTEAWSALSVPETVLDGSGSESHRYTATVANGCLKCKSIWPEARP